MANATTTRSILADERQVTVPSPKLPVYNRQRFLLAFIQQLDKSISARDLQKLVFMYSMKKSADHYDFVPYKYGAYSFQLAQDVEVLKLQGHLIPSSERIESVCHGKSLQVDARFVDEQRGNSLVRKAYTAYPYYAINSTIADRLLDQSAMDAVKATKQRLQKSEQRLFSIGYEGMSIEYFLNVLLGRNVRLLCDVRQNPLSRKFGFSKKMLQHVTEQVGIKYVHVPELGIEPQKRQSLETPEDYKALFAEYEKTLPSREAALQQVYSLFRTYSRIALMCYERDPDFCHRTLVKNSLISTYQMESEEI